MKKTPLVLIFAFLLNSIGPVPQVRAEDFRLPAPGVMVRLSPPVQPPLLKGIKVDVHNPFKFDFLLDPGENESNSAQLKVESAKLIKYFLASLTVPDQDLWVNLSPYEKDRIIPSGFGLTEMGRDLLAEDYLLKQITASLIYPEHATGKKFWKRMYQEAVKRYGTTNIPVNTFNKVWIVPQKAVVFENAQTGSAYVVDSRLKVMLEEDYLSIQKHGQASAEHALGSQMIREIVIPELTKEVNEDKNFTRLRQVYQSLILAAWYKKKIKDSILEKVYCDKNKVGGISINDPLEKQKIYQRYLQAFKKGVYNYIKEDIDPVTQEAIPRKYFSGGVNFAMNSGRTSLNTGSALKIVDRKTASASMLSVIKNTAGLLLVAASLSVSAPGALSAANAVSDVKAEQNTMALQWSGVLANHDYEALPGLLASLKNNETLSLNNHLSAINEKIKAMGFYVMGNGTDAVLFKSAGKDSRGFTRVQMTAESSLGLSLHLLSSPTDEGIMMYVPSEKGGWLMPLTIKDGAIGGQFEDVINTLIDVLEKSKDSQAVESMLKSIVSRYATTVVGIEASDFVPLYFAVENLNNKLKAKGYLLSYNLNLLKIDHWEDGIFAVGEMAAGEKYFAGETQTSQILINKGTFDFLNYTPPSDQLLYYSISRILKDASPQVWQMRLQKSREIIKQHEKWHWDQKMQSAKSNGIVVHPNMTLEEYKKFMSPVLYAQNHEEEMTRLQHMQEQVNQGDMDGLWINLELLSMKIEGDSNFMWSVLSANDPVALQSAIEAIPKEPDPLKRQQLKAKVESTIKRNLQQKMPSTMLEWKRQNALAANQAMKAESEIRDITSKIRSLNPKEDRKYIDDLISESKNQLTQLWAKLGQGIHTEMATLIMASLPEDRMQFLDEAGHEHSILNALSRRLKGDEKQDQWLTWKTLKALAVRDITKDDLQRLQMGIPLVLEGGFKDLNEFIDVQNAVGALEMNIDVIRPENDMEPIVVLSTGEETIVFKRFTGAFSGHTHHFLTPLRQSPTDDEVAKQLADIGVPSFILAVNKNYKEKPPQGGRSKQKLVAQLMYYEQGQWFSDRSPLPDAQKRIAQRLMDWGVIKKVLKDRAMSAQDRQTLQAYLEQVFLPVIGQPLPAGVTLAREEVNGIPELTIEHREKEPRSGKEQLFRYKIRFTDRKSIKSKDGAVKGEFILEVPKPAVEPWDGELVQEMKYAMRRLMIADPINGRFSGKFTLDPYQQEAIASIIREFENGSKALTVMATATGKTVVAFESMNRYLDAAKAKGEHPGAVIFIVNNSIILREAQKKLNDMFPGKYTTSRIYGGKADYSGEVIFATPGSLANSRLRTLMDRQKIGLVIFDEVHHLPSDILKSIYTGIEEESSLKKSNTKFLGMTATEVRPDRKSVIGLFERNIVYEYSIQHGLREGALVPMKYLSGDQDLLRFYKGPKDVILSSDPRWEELRDYRYSNARFDHLYNLYKEYTRELLDKRGLILAPNVERARALAADFRRRGVAAVSLTGADETEDPDAFEANYEAWKTGKWADPNRKDPEPEIVVAVDIFKEGTDVPAINFLMLWGDTNSTIEFLQSIGRGLRLAKFKQNLVIVDAIGLYRKLHLLRALGGLVGDSVDNVFEGVPADKEDDRVHETHPPVVTLSQDISELLNDYLNDVPSRLTDRYGTYAGIPENVLKSIFDPWLAEKSGFLTGLETPAERKTSMQNFYRIFEDFRQKTALSQNEKTEFRKTFLMAFHYQYKEANPDNVEELTIDFNNPDIKLIYERIAGLLLEGLENPEYMAGVIDEMFPEFSVKMQQKMKLRGQNLRWLRERFFRKTPVQIAQVLLEDVVKNTEIRGKLMSGEFAGDEDFRQLINEMERLEPNSTRSFLLENRFELAEDLRGVRSGDENVEGHIRGYNQQDLLIELYKHHPKLAFLSNEDFNLPHDQFVAKVSSNVDQRLLIEPKTMEELLNALASVSEGYQKSAVEGALTAFNLKRQSLLKLLKDYSSEDYFEYKNLTEAFINRLLETSQAVHAVSKLNPSFLSEEDAEIARILKEILRKSGISWDVTETGNRYSLHVENYKRPTEQRNYFYMKVASSGNRVADVQFDLLEDAKGTWYLNLSNRLDTYYHSLSELERLELLNIITGLIEKLQNLLKADVTVTLNNDPVDPDFFKDLYLHLLKSTDINLLGPLLPSISSADAKYNVQEIVSKSRVSYLTPEYIQNMFNEYGLGQKAATKSIFVNILSFKYELTPFWNSIKTRLGSFHSENSTVMAARDKLLVWMTQLMGSMNELQIEPLKNTFRLLGEDQSVPLNDMEILRAYIYLGFKTGELAFLSGSDYRRFNEFLTRVRRWFLSHEGTMYAHSDKIDEKINNLISDLVTGQMEGKALDADSFIQQVLVINKILLRPQDYINELEASGQLSSSKGPAAGHVLAPFFKKDETGSYKMVFAGWREYKRGAWIYYIDWNLARARQEAQRQGKDLKYFLSTELYNPVTRSAEYDFVPVGLDTPASGEEWISMEEKRNEGTDYAKNHDVDDDFNPITDKAQLAKGGIDLTAARTPLQVLNAGQGIKFHLDASMLKRLQNAPGFTPVVISIKPLNSLEKFLGLARAENLAPSDTS